MRLVFIASLRKASVVDKSCDFRFGYYVCWYVIWMSLTELLLLLLVISFWSEIRVYHVVVNHITNRCSGNFDSNSIWVYFQFSRAFLLYIGSLLVFLLVLLFSHCNECVEYRVVNLIIYTTAHSIEYEKIIRLNSSLSSYNVFLLRFKINILRLFHIYT